MDNKEAAQLLVSLYADYRTGYGKKEEYAEAVATAAMAMAQAEKMPHPATTTAPDSWFLNESTIQNTAK